MSWHPGRCLVAVFLPIAIAAGCGDDDDDAEGDAGTSVATFQVAGDQTYKIELATPELIAHTERLLAGEEIAAIPLGTVVRDDPGVNEPWSWHIDPTTLEFAVARRGRGRHLRPVLPLVSEGDRRRPALVVGQFAARLVSGAGGPVDLTLKLPFPRSPLIACVLCASEIVAWAAASLI